MEKILILLSFAVWCVCQCALVLGISCMVLAMGSETHRHTTKAEISGLGVSVEEFQDGSLHPCDLSCHDCLMSGVHH